ncbi:MAG: right-handed parallel beta-helix repeat-containing protein [Kiritimatiellia bacterium]
MNNLSAITPPCPNGWINACECGASGSEFQASGRAKAGSNEIAVDDIGDFKVGQEVAVYGCHLHHYGTVYNAEAPYFARNQKPLAGEAELRGLDAGKLWQTFIVHFDKTDPVTFSWMAVDTVHQTKVRHHPVLHREWCWQGKNMPVTNDWMTLADGVQIRFRKLDWQAGESISFHARNRLLARIEGIRGKNLVLDSKANLDADGVKVRHHDQSALQAALDRAVAERKGLFIPAGRYRLSKGVWIINATVRIEGAHRDQTTLDISDDHTAVFWISGGQEVVIRNLGMVGHTGFLELPANTHFPTATGFAYWPTANQQMEIKGCAAANFVGTEHLLFEDLKVSRMASEAFYSHGADRYGLPPYIQAPHEGRPELLKQYTKSCVFHRCHVSDCGFNAFNNNDHAENTSILHCHVERATNFCENASRFTRIIGNYVLDGCATSVHGGSADDPRKIGPTQAVIADNVFEGGTLSGGVSVGNHATQVVVANNIFIGYSKESAIFILGGRRVVVSGNHIDLTRIENNPDNERCGICVEASNVIIADNHVYVRGERSEKATGIHVADHAVNIHIHDNIIENCQDGFRTGRRDYVPQGEGGRFEFRHTGAEVGEVIDRRRFRASSLPMLCDDAAPYRGWNLRWLTGPNAGRTTAIEGYERKDRIVALKDDIPLQAGEKFAVYPRSANWQIHHNTIAGCTRPMTIDLLGLEGVNIKDNIISPPESAG